jgi:hypothetical protein
VFLSVARRSIPERDHALGVALIVGFALSVLPGATVLVAERGGASGFHDVVVLRGADLVLAGAVALSAPAVPAWWRRAPTWLRWIVVAWATATSVALAASPSWRGVEQILRAGAAALLVAGVLDLRRTPWFRRVLAAVAVVAVAQAAVGMIQVLTGRTLTAAPLITTSRLWDVDGTPMAMGTFVHPYFLAATLLVGGAAAAVAASSRPGWPWTVAAVAIGGGLATTFSRAAALGLLLLAVGAAAHARADRRRLAVPVALVVGFLLVALLVAPGWTARATASATGSLDEVGSGRLQRAEEAVALWRSDPLTGVGPGRYVLELPDDAPDRLPAHNLPLHAAAEAGAVAGSAAAVGLVGVGLLAWRRGPLSAGVFASLAPFLVLDAYPYTFPHGFVLVGLWLALVAASPRQGLDSSTIPGATGRASTSAPTGLAPTATSRSTPRSTNASTASSTSSSSTNT